MGDTVTPISPQDKHKTREIYLVTGQEGEKISAQRLLHSLSKDSIKFMSREYEINPKHLQRIHHPPSLESSIFTSKETYEKSYASTTSTQVNAARKPWSPINPKYYKNDSSDDDDEDDIDHDGQDDQVLQILAIPITPPLSNEIGFLSQNLFPESQESSSSSPEALSDLDVHLSDSDQSIESQTNTSTDVLDGDYLTRDSNILEVRN